MTRIGLTIASCWFLATAACAAVLQVPAEYATIQAAVNAAAPGDTVMVAAGVYEEQVVIGSDLVLLGAGVGQTVVQAPPSLPYAVGSDQYRGVICADQTAAEVTVAQLTIDGLGRNPSSGRFVGLLFYRTGGRIADLEVHSIHNTPVDGATSGIGVLVTLDQQTMPTSLTVAGVVIRRFQKAGLVVSGMGFTVDIADVEVDPEDVYSSAVQNGIELTRVVVARVARCTVRNVTYHGTPRPEYTAAGFLANVCGSLELRDSTFEQCQTGCYLVRTPSVSEKITVVSPSLAASPNYGLVSVGAINLEAANNGPDAIRAPRPLMAGAAVGERPPVVFDVKLRDSVIDGGGRPTSRGVVLRAYTAEAQGFSAERCEVSDWNEGVLSLEAGFGAVYGRLSGCRIDGNTAYGIRALTASPLDARGCRWRDPSGPYHPVTNPDGSGDTVNDQVLYDPWLAGNLAPLPLPQAISLADLQGTVYADAVSVEYFGGAEDLLYGYSLQLTWDPDVIRLAAIGRPARGMFADAVFFQVLSSVGTATVDAAVGGDQAGIASGPLCMVRFEAVGMPDWTPSTVAISLLHARNRLNQPIAGFVIDAGVVAVDLQPPVISQVEISNETLDHTDDFAKDGDLLAATALITDGDPTFGRGGVRGIGAYLFGAPYLILPPDGYANDQAVWTARPAMLTPPNGTAYFYVEAIDPAGNATSPLVADTIIADNIRPLAVTGLIAVTGHNRIDLAWNDATGSDINFRHTVIRANSWQDYPFYDGAEPSYPATAAAGAPVYAGQDNVAAAVYPADGSERDIYYFGALAVDMAGNTSSLGTGARARATNYRLGDVRAAPSGSAGDGIIDLYDITRLGDTFGLLRGETGFDGECDVAPADGGQAGVPVPDEAIDFDDLMIFADQFYLDRAGRAAPSVSPSGSVPVALRWDRIAPEIWALVLASPCPELKGLRLQGDAGGATLRLEAGALLRAQPGPWFLHPGRGGLAASLAILGRGIGMVGEGELLRLVANAPIELSVPAVELRDIENRPLIGTLPSPSDIGGELPAVFHAGRPTPNPFNPVTEIAFDLPSPQRVGLVIYRLDGKRVCRVLAADLPAGRHTARWHGRDDAGRPVGAGTYLYRLVAGPWSATGKLELIK